MINNSCLFLDSQNEGLPRSFWCWSRKDVSESVIRNDFAIRLSYSSEGTVMNKIETRFKINNTHIICLNSEPWVEDLLKNNSLISSGYMQWIPCLTNSGHLVNFQLIHGTTPIL